MLRDRERLLFGNAGDDAAIGCRDRLPFAVPGGYPIHRLVGQHGKPEIARIARGACRLHRVVRRQRDLLPLDVGQRCQPFPVRKAGKSDIHHHHAGNEPHGEKQAGDDADPAVADIQPPPQCAFQGACHAQNFTLTASCAVRGMPSSHCVVPPDVV